MSLHLPFVQLPDEIKADFFKLSIKLSPENLSCDGERTRAQTDAAYQKIMQQWRGLEAQHGVSVSEEEVQQWYLSRARRPGVGL